VLSVIGQVLRSDGWTLSADDLGVVDDVAWVPAGAYLAEQSPDLGVHFGHDRSWRLGTVGYLERSDRLGLMAVATLDADVGDLLADGPWFWSDSITCKRRGQALVRTDALLRELSLVRETGNCGTRPVVTVPGDIARGSAPQPRHMPMAWDDTWTRAAEAMSSLRYRHLLHTPIFDVDGPAADQEMSDSFLFGHRLTRAMADVVADALADPATEHLPIRDRIAIGAATTHRR
jgi:hypothetical protein